MSKSALVCPTCGTPFESHPGEIIGNCGVCGADYSISNGIIDFIPNEKFYWGEISEELMTQINDHAEKSNWFEALTTHLSGKNSHLLNYILDPVRYAGLFTFYDASMSDACLDLGSGWGPISFGLSRFYKKVYSLDGVYERLRFQSIRAAQSQIQNIQLLRSTMLKFPVSDSSMDAVIINGLLEWIGLSESEGNPQLIQERFLREVYRVLKPNGRIMIGIENRFGLQYFLGGKDHTGLRFTSLMPRKLADFVVRKSRRGDDALVFTGAENDYRTLTYSYWGYKNLLNKIGFTQPQVYWAWPGYNYPRVTGSTQGSSIKYYLRNISNLSDRRLIRFLIHLAQLVPEFMLGFLLKLLSPHFLITACKESTICASLQDKIIGGQTPQASFIRTSLGTRSDFKTTYQRIKQGRLEKIYCVTEEKQNEGSKLCVRESPVIQGRTIHRYNLEEIALTAHWLANFQAENNQGIWTIEDLINEVSLIASKIQKAFPDRQSLHSRLEQYVDEYKAHLSGISCPVVKEHGDFTPVNILVDSEHKVKVIDWEYSKSKGNPLMDFGSFSLSLLRGGGQLKANILTNAHSKALSRFVQEYQSHTKIELPAQLAPGYYLLRVIARELGNFSDITPENYLTVMNWMQYLEPCLAYGCQTPI